MFIGPVALRRSFDMAQDDKFKVNFLPHPDKLSVTGSLLFKTGSYLSPIILRTIFSTARWRRSWSPAYLIHLA